MMKFAFSTLACPKWDFDTIASKAKEMGYDGVEIRSSINETTLTASNVFLSDPAKLKALFKYHQVEVACISTPVAFAQDGKGNDARATEIRKAIDIAAAMDCPLVKVLDTQVRAGQERGMAGAKLGDFLAPLGDYAQKKLVKIVIENGLSFRHAKEMWAILDRLSHPNIACCWDNLSAALVGERPLISIPTLNSRIAFVQIKDAKIGPLGATYTKLGEGDLPLEQLLRRLQGIGYNGYVSFEWEKAFLPGIAEPEEVLPHAIAKLKDLTKPQLEPKPAKKEHAAPAKPAAPAATATK